MNSRIELKLKTGLIFIGISTLVATILGYLVFIKHNELNAPFYLLLPILFGVGSLIIYFAFFWVSKSFSFAVSILLGLMNVILNLVLIMIN
jgi:hypothetical protein